MIGGGGGGGGGGGRLGRWGFIFKWGGCPMERGIGFVGGGGSKIIIG